jgi:hypothetical protein
MFCEAAGPVFSSSARLQRLFSRNRFNGDRPGDSEVVPQQSGRGFQERVRQQ